MKSFRVVLLLLICLLAGCTQPASAPASEAASQATAAPSVAVTTTAPAAADIELCGKHFTGKESSLSLILSEEEFDRLESFDALTSLDLSGSTCYEKILSYQAEHPEVQVRYTVQLDDEKVPGDTTELTLPTLSNVADLAYLPSLRALTVEHPLSPAQAAELVSLLPKAELTYSVAFAGLTVDRSATFLDLSGIRAEETSDAMAALDLLPQVTAVKLSAADKSSPWTLEQAVRLVQSRPEMQVDYVANVFGVTFTFADEVVNFNNIDLSDRVEELRSVLPGMIHVGRLDMENCNIPDEQMDALRKEFPAPKIVWRVHVKSYSCRTDAIMIRFSECNDALRLRSEDLTSLKYCNEMRYLDLGHNYISSAFFTAYMPDLEVCILAVERELTDISALANCSKLEYLEIFTGKLTDISPLAKCKNLKHLNICCNNISDISPLFELNLERLWLSRNFIKSDQIRSFCRQFPDCQVNYTVTDPTSGTWRFRGNYLVPRYALLRKQFCYDALYIRSYSAFDDPNKPQ